MAVHLGQQLHLLMDSLGIDHDDFEQFLVWALSEHLVSYLSREREMIAEFRDRLDGLKQFRSFARRKTGRQWSQRDIEALYERVKVACEPHYRKPIAYGDLLRLLFNSKHECAQCQSMPPDVKLHIDHKHPASKGGLSRYQNLQFLCADCNVKKSNKIERIKEQWLNFE